MVDRRQLYDLYERAAQSPERQARFVEAIAGETARCLAEDFSGAGALSIAWAGLSGAHVASALDRDLFPLELLRERADRAGVSDRVEIIEGDATAASHGADVIAVFNFSVGYFHERPQLAAYLRSARERLGEKGVFVCDIYGGIDQFERGESELDLSDGARYIWEQREADPLTGRVVNAMHFFLDSGEEYRDAFVYDWRLWSPAELADVMLEAGFASVEHYDRLGDAEFDDGALLVSPARGDELDENYVLYIAGRT